MRSRRPALIAALLVLAAVLWWLALGGRDRPEELSAAPSSEPAAAPQPVAAPRASEPAPGAPPAAVEPAPATPAVEPATEPLQPSAAGPIPPDTRGFVAALEEVYESSPRATDARKTEAELERLFRGEGVSPGLLRSVSCREHVCRLELRWTPEHADIYQRAMEELTAGNAKNLATRAEEPDGRGLVSVEAFWRRAAREGR